MRIKNTKQWNSNRTEKENKVKIISHTNEAKGHTALLFLERRPRRRKLEPMKATLTNVVLKNENWKSKRQITILVLYFLFRIFHLSLQQENKHQPQTKNLPKTLFLG